MKNKILLKFLVLFAFAIINISSTYNTFINLGFPAIDIGTGSEGDICVVGIDKYAYCYDFMDDTWTKYSTHLIDEIERIDVDDDGTVYITSKCGVYYLDCENRWIRLPGKATDIGVGVDFTVWKVGTDEIKVVDGSKTIVNYGIWKLICDCECLCLCRRRCIRFRLRDYDPCHEDTPPKCYWFRTDGYGKRIDVFPNGDAIVSINRLPSSNSTLKVINYDGKYFRDYKCGTSVFNRNSNDVTVGNTGVVFVSVMTTGDLYKCDKNNNFIQVVLKPIRDYTFLGADCPATPRNLKADNISAGSYNQVSFTHLIITIETPDCNDTLNQRVFTGSRFEYLDRVPKTPPNFIAYKSLTRPENAGNGKGPKDKAVVMPILKPSPTPSTPTKPLPAKPNKK